MDNALRFGDVIKGFISTTPNIKEPMLDSVHKDYRLNISLPDFCIVMSPCCSIADKIIALAPLIGVRNTFFKNPYFAEDLTRINRQMEPQQTLPPNEWQNLSNEEKQKRLSEGFSYVFLEFFIYEKHDLFPKYFVHRKEGKLETNYYMIDFRHTFRVDCEKIIKPDNVPIETKVLQLSIKTRGELRDKISFYFARVPNEDKILED